MNDSLDWAQLIITSTTIGVFSIALVFVMIDRSCALRKMNISLDVSILIRITNRKEE